MMRTAVIATALLLAAVSTAQAQDVNTVNICWYAFWRGVFPNNVHVPPRPEDCDYESAPLGNKGCHYAKVMFTMEADCTADSHKRPPPLSVEVQWLKLPGNSGEELPWGCATSELEVLQMMEQARMLAAQKMDEQRRRW